MLPCEGLMFRTIRKFVWRAQISVIFYLVRDRQWDLISVGCEHLYVLKPGTLHCGIKISVWLWNWTHHFTFSIVGFLGINFALIRHYFTTQYWRHALILVFGAFTWSSTLEYCSIYKLCNKMRFSTTHTVSKYELCCFQKQNPLPKLIKSAKNRIRLPMYCISTADEILSWIYWKGVAA